MTATREEMKLEAIERMKSIDIFPETIKQFDVDGKISISEPPLGAFYWLDEKEQQIVEQFEQQYNALVYVGVRCYTNIGCMDAYLYVSDEKDEWDDDRENLKNHEPLAYVWNNDAPDCSEIGQIGIEPTCAAGIRRVW